MEAASESSEGSQLRMPVKAAHGRELRPLSAEGRSENLHRPHLIQHSPPWGKGHSEGKGTDQLRPRSRTSDSPQGLGQGQPQQRGSHTHTALATPSLAP